MRQTLGEQELELLRYLSERTEPVTVGEVAEGYGVPHGLSRSTVVTMMDRLRAKGYLGRQRQDGVFRYTVLSGQTEVMGSLIERFVERTLAGSLTPLTAYFANRQRLTPEELDQLSRLLTKLEDANNDNRKES